MIDNTKRTALVTGATSGIGLEITKRLLKSGYIVYGIGRDINKVHFDKVDINNFDINTENLKLFSLDITSKKALEDFVGQLKKDKALPDILIHSAGVGYYGMHEEIKASNLEKLIATNVTAPIELTNMLLRHLKEVKGHIIFISSITADNSNPHGAAYGASKAALASFSRSLFDESRKYGLHVTTIKPDMTSTDLYRNADFTCSEDMDAHLEPADVADAVEYAINARSGINISEIKLQPQRLQIVRKPK